MVNRNIISNLLDVCVCVCVCVGVYAWVREKDVCEFLVSSIPT